ncbi:MAG: diguanylate cyclase [Candidatus Omnitrophica bacterium]|nr:diguanylate cyclase [Candidatus Omnitrophota bacterium]
MTPFTKRNLLVPVSVILFTGLLYLLIEVVPALRGYIQHLEFIVLGIMIMMSLVIMFFWVSTGVLGGLSSFLIAMIFLYKPLTALNPYYYSVLILAFFINSFTGYYISRKINVSNQGYTVTMEKVQEDINLITNHMNSRRAEVAAMAEKVNSLLGLKNIADNLSSSLSEDEIVKLTVKKTLEMFGGEKGEKRVLLYMVDEAHNELNLAYALKGRKRAPTSMKKGGIFDRWVMKNVKSLLVRDIGKDFRFSVENEEAEEDFISLISKPLIIEGNVMGLLRVDSPEQSAFGQHELRILDIIGELGAVAMENARLYRQTEELAIRDSLTGLFVRRYFMERMQGELKRTLLGNRQLALLMIDIDDFKDFNDQHGHIAGDAVLKNIGRILLSKASPGDIVGRYGGEEFVFLSLNSGREEAEQLAEDLRREIEKKPIVLRREKQFVTVSIGVAMFPEDAKLKDDIIWEADKRLYGAKAKGKNQVCSR